MRCPDAGAARATSSKCGRGQRDWPGGYVEPSESWPFNRSREQIAARLAKRSAASATRSLNGVPCVEWLGAVASTTTGYGEIRFGIGKREYVHRLAYLVHVGEIPAGMTIDHLCCNTRCVEPRHLEVVTNSENSRRVAIRRNAKKARAS